MANFKHIFDLKITKQKMYHLKTQKLKKDACKIVISKWLSN